MDDRTIKNIRRSIIRMAYKSNASHTGSCLSIVEILYVLYFKILRIDPDHPLKDDRDRFILSKAHASAALYATLAERGFFPEEYLDRYFVDNGILPGHLNKDSVPGIETSGGSLGHGLSLATGMALARHRRGRRGRVFTLLSDGECNEGSVWEAIMLASTMKLNNMIAIVDFNKLQAFGRTNEVINMENLADRWRVFGWTALEVDGHDCMELEKAFKVESDAPLAVIAHTVKGRGISFMEDRLEWHYRSPDEKLYRMAMEELE